MIRAVVTKRDGETMTVHAPSFEKLFEELADVDYISVDACDLERAKNKQLPEEENDG